MPKIYQPEEFGTNKFINLLRTKSIVVYEDVQGSKIWVRWNGMNWEIRPKTHTNQPLNMVDMAVQKFYNQAYLYLLSLPAETTDFLDRNTFMCFEYFCDEQPAHIKYKRVPKNSLVLTCLFKKNKYVYDTIELRAMAALLGTDVVPILYRGRLTEPQIQSINRYLHTSPVDLELLFDESNFAKFFYDLLSPNTKSSFLMGDGDYQDNLEKIIIRFDDDSEVSFQLLNPLFKKTAGQTDFEDVYSVILLNFLQFAQTVDLNTIPLASKTGDSMFIELVCHLYNRYMQQSSTDLMRFNFTVPSFFNKDKFKINTSFISNATTIDWVKKSVKFEYVLKIVLTALQKEKRKAFGVFTDRTVAVFNILVKDVRNRIHRQLEINAGRGAYKNKALTVGEFTDLKSIGDGSGKPWLDWTPDKSPVGSKKKKPDVVKKK